MDWNLTQEIVIKISAVDMSCADDIVDLFCNEIQAEQMNAEIDNSSYRVSLFLTDFSRVESVRSRLLEFCKDYEKKNNIF